MTTEPSPSTIINGPPTDPSDVLVWIGDHEIGPSGETTLPEKQVGVVKLTHHPNYPTAVGEDSSAPYDLTVMELEEAVDLYTYRPACMAKTTDATTFDGKMATVAGWGHLEECPDPPPATGCLWPDPLVPHEVELPVLPASECPGPNGSPGDICAGGSAEGGKDSCQVGLYYINRYQFNKILIPLERQHGVENKKVGYFNY